MKPFNLKEALAGKKVVTRLGKEVTQLTLFHNVKDHNVIGVLDDEKRLLSWTESGIYQLRSEGALKQYDLFMAI